MPWSIHQQVESLADQSPDILFGEKYVVQGVGHDAFGITMLLIRDYWLLACNFRRVKPIRDPLVTNPGKIGVAGI
jgi:hypothetical protein